MTIEPTTEAILAFAAQRAQETWDEKQQPYLLSRLSPELSQQGIDYKGVLGEQRLKDFMRSAPGLIKVVSHPTQKSRIGLIPPHIDFEFESATAATPQHTPLSQPASPAKGKLPRRAYIVSSFLQLLAELDESDSQQVQIPLAILTKLMRDQ